MQHTGTAKHRISQVVLRIESPQMHRAMPPFNLSQCFKSQSREIRHTRGFDDPRAIRESFELAAGFDHGAIGTARIETTSDLRADAARIGQHEPALTFE